MDARLLDVIIGLSGFLILIVMLAVLPMVMVAGVAYLAAIVIFILFLSGAGYLVNDKIVWQVILPQFFLKIKKWSFFPYDFF